MLSDLEHFDWSCRQYLLSSGTNVVSRALFPGFGGGPFPATSAKPGKSALATRLSRNRVRYSRYRVSNLKSICRRIRKYAFSFLMFRKSMFPFNNDKLNFTRNQYSSDVLLRTWIPTIAPMLAANTKTKTRLSSSILG